MTFAYYSNSDVLTISSDFIRTPLLWNSEDPYWVERLLSLIIKQIDISPRNEHIVIQVCLQNNVHHLHIANKEFEFCNCDICAEFKIKSKIIGDILGC